MWMGLRPPSCCHQHSKLAAPTPPGYPPNSPMLRQGPTAHFGSRRPGLGPPREPAIWSLHCLWRSAPLGRRRHYRRLLAATGARLCLEPNAAARATMLQGGSPTRRSPSRACRYSRQPHLDARGQRGQRLPAARTAKQGWPHRASTAAHRGRQRHLRPCQTVPAEEGRHNLDGDPAEIQLWQPLRPPPRQRQAVPSCHRTSRQLRRRMPGRMPGPSV
mmetsp:Transcript_4720/g.11009  ORF Transcript_4720/g.11009 Transcript_4720/m.11009 type:complete len:217 (-) Transcript_4720:60-710(-)